MKSKFLGMMTIMIMTAFIFSSCSNAEADADAKDVVEKSENAAIYNVELQTTDGQKISMSEFKGKVIIIDFWDTWCPPCRMEIPHFVELHNEYKDKGLVIVGAAFGRQGVEAVKQFAVDYNITYVNSLASQSLVNVFGGAPSSIPTTYIVDTNGNIHKKYVGYNEKSVFEKEIKSLLNL